MYLPAAIQDASIKAETDCFLFLSYDNKLYCYITTGTLLYKSDLSSYKEHGNRMQIDFDPATYTATFGVDNRLWLLEQGEKVNLLAKGSPAGWAGYYCTPVAGRSGPESPSSRCRRSPARKPRPTTTRLPAITCSTTLLGLAIFR